MKTAVAMGALVLTAALAASPGANGALIDLGSDFRDDGYSEIGFVGEGRIGSNSVGGATFEYDLGKSTSAPGAQGELAWGNGTSHAFSLTFDGATANFSIQGGNANPLTYSGFAFTDDFNALVFRLGAYDGTIDLTDLVLNGTSLGSLSKAGGVNYWAATDSFGSGFTLTGTAALSWTGSTPRNSGLSFQFKGMNAPVNDVPEPASMAIFATGLLGLGWMARRRRHSA